jgi:hypothetical protein
MMSRGVLETFRELEYTKKKIVSQVGYLQELNRDAQPTKHKKGKGVKCIARSFRI